MMGFDGPFEDVNSGGIPNGDNLDEHEAYLMLLARREEMIYVQHQVTVNAFQAKTFMYGMTGMMIGAAIVMSIAWSIWYWIK
jgi:hypothetical protein